MAAAILALQVALVLVNAAAAQVEEADKIVGMVQKFELELQNGAAKEADLDKPQPSAPAGPGGVRTAICLSGQAREFELTGPSIIQRLLPAYPGTHLFLSTTYDEGTFKLFAFDWAPENVTLAAVRVSPLEWVDEAPYRKGLLVWERMDKSNMFVPHWEQAFFQQFKLLRSCVEMITGHEAQHGFAFDWVMHTRVDTFWHDTPTPLSKLQPGADNIPAGHNWWGVNDRLCIGSRTACLTHMSRFKFYETIPRYNKTAVLLNAEGFLKAGLDSNGVAINRFDMPFCVITHKQRGGEVCAALSSPGPLNGYDCRPCFPMRKGQAAKDYVKSHKFYNPAAYPPDYLFDGIHLCEGMTVWPKEWSELFDNAPRVGPTLAAQRQLIARVTPGECLTSFRSLKSRAASWEGASPMAVCLRRALGPLASFGEEGHSFYTFLGHMAASVKGFNGAKDQGIAVTIVLHTAVVPKDSKMNTPASWRLAVERKLRAQGDGSLKVTHTFAAPSNPELCGMRAGVNATVAEKTVRKAMQPAHTLLLSLPRGYLKALLDTWRSSLVAPPVCQLLVAYHPFAHPREEKEAGSQKVSASRILRDLGFELSACAKEPFVDEERCTYFSLAHCRVAPT